MNDDGMQPDYLKKRYGSRFWAVQGQDGVWNLRTRVRTQEGIEGDVFVYGPGRLGVLTTPIRGRVLLADPVFTLHQDAEDAMVLLFPEGELEKVADRLHMRRRTQLTPEERAKRVERLRRFRFAPASNSAKTG